jgi:hypothetical protein
MSSAGGEALVWKGAPCTILGFGNGGFSQARWRLEWREHTGEQRTD